MTCEYCEKRIMLARCFDVHFDFHDCPFLYRCDAHGLRSNEEKNENNEEAERNGAEKEMLYSAADTKCH